MKKRSITPVTLFFAVSLLGTAGFFVYAFFAGAPAYDWLAMANNGKDSFCDFFMHLSFVADPEHLYSRAVNETGCFPPFAYLMYGFFYRLIARDSVIPADYHEVSRMDYALTICNYYSIISVFLLLLGIHLAGRRRPKLDVLLFFTLIFSVEFYQGGIENANSIILVLALILIALTLRKSQAAWQRELALVLIAVCTGLKIYPAILGMLYIQEKRYAEAARLALYGVLLFFLPFPLFGGMDGFLLWLENVRTTMGHFEFGRVEYIKGLVFFVTRMITGENMFLSARISACFFLIAMLLLSGASRSRYRRVFFLCAIMTFFPANAYRYTLSYLAIPLIFFIKEYGGDRRPVTYITMLLYGLLFTLPVFWGALTGFQPNFLAFFRGIDLGEFLISTELTFVEVYIYGVAYILLLFTTVTELANQISARCRKQKNYWLNPCFLKKSKLVN